MRPSPILLSGLLALTFASQAALAAKPSPHLAAAKKAEKTNDYATALSEYRAADADTPSAEAAIGIARNQEATSDLIGAYASYRAFLDAPPGKPTPAQIKEATAHLEKLTNATVGLTVHADPEGTALALDGKDVGVAPLAKPLRVLPGTHTIKGTKAEYVARTETVDVTGGEERTVDVHLSVEPTTGHVTVHDTQNRPLELTVDGAMVGTLPWAGDLPPGTHHFLASSNIVRAPEKVVDVTRGSSADVAVDGAVRTGGVDLSIAGGQGIVLLDNVAVGQGSYTGHIPIGPHHVAFSREGFKPVDAPLDVVEGRITHVAATLNPVKAATPVDNHESGGVGALLLAGSVQMNNPGSESDRSCAGVGTNCTGGAPAGGALFFSRGYEWKYHLGFDIQVGLTADTSRRSYDHNAESHPYFFDRAGAIESARFRASVQNDDFRGTLAIGPGVSERGVAIGYGSESFPTNFKGGSFYASLGLNIDLSVQWRFSGGTALALGTLFWIESAGDGAVSTNGPANGNFHIVSGTQAMIYPYIGLVFGP